MADHSNPKLIKQTSKNKKQKNKEIIIANAIHLQALSGTARNKCIDPILVLN